MTLEQLVDQFRIVGDIQQERQYQDKKWGGPKHDDQLSLAAWPRITQDYLRKALNAAVINDRAEYRRQMIKVGALALAAIESFDRIDEENTGMR